MWHYVNNSQKGVVLLTVLLLIHILTLLGLIMMQMAVLHEHLSQSEWQQTNCFLMAEESLTKIENDLVLNLMFCRAKALSNNNWQENDLNWWENNSPCTQKKGAYVSYFWVEKIGEDPCATVLMPRVPGSVPTYFRITVMVMQHPTEVKEILQATDLLFDNSLSICHGQLHPVNLGRQTWIELR